MANVQMFFDPCGASLGGSQIPELISIAPGTITTNFPSDGYAFDGTGTTIERIFFKFRAINYASGNITVDIDWYSRSGSTSGNVKWDASIAAVTPGDAVSMEAKTFATANTVTTTVNGTAKGLTRSTITISNLDSLAIDDFVQLNIDRDPNSDTMVGDAICRLVTVTYLSV